VAIACGGTGGHLFPGLAVAEQIMRHGCPVTLLISAKEVDRQAAQQAAGMDIVTLPAIGLTRGRGLAFLRGFVRSYREAKQAFQVRPPRAVLAMGGFTCAPPVLAAKWLRAQAFLHESNIIPGRANRWLSWVVGQAFVGFPSTAARLHCRQTVVTGTPVRAQFHPREVAACRVALGLEPARPVVLVVGGSQGASGLNQVVAQALPLLARSCPDWQWLHLSGANDEETVSQTYERLNLKAVVHPFLAGMELALGAAAAAISRAGASSLAELAAMRVPAVLVPFPAAADNHQFYNAQAYEQTGAARLLEQKHATPEALLGLVTELVQDSEVRGKMQGALAQWHAPRAAEQIAEHTLRSITMVSSTGAAVSKQTGPSTGAPNVDRLYLDGRACLSRHGIDPRAKLEIELTGANPGAPSPARPAITHAAGASGGCV
jgi:UDP-N-acetylglucosamine--N-acetylmuramyl-(pentapeptide) pyrophosphoryl-undecaprenol N-acetylglucosamine transferase